MGILPMMETIKTPMSDPTAEAMITRVNCVKGWEGRMNLSAISMQMHMEIPMHWRIIKLSIKVTRPVLTRNPARIVLMRIVYRKYFTLFNAIGFLVLFIIRLPLRPRTAGGKFECPWSWCHTMALFSTLDYIHGNRTSQPVGDQMEETGGEMYNSGCWVLWVSEVAIYEKLWEMNFQIHNPGLKSANAMSEDKSDGLRNTGRVNLISNQEI